MKPHELFGVVVRSIGLGCIVSAILMSCNIITAVSNQAGFAIWSIFVAAVDFFLGYYLLVRADKVVRIAYPETSEE